MTPVTFPFKGQPAQPFIDAQVCNHCGLCAAVCSYGPLVRGEDGTVRIDPAPRMACMGCGACVRVCPTGAVRISGRGMQIDDAFDLPAAHDRATADQLHALSLSRRSVRQFTARDVDCADLDRIIEITATAPMSFPPHEVGVVIFQGRDKVQQLAQATLCAMKASRPWIGSPMLALMRPLLSKGQYQMMRDAIVPLADMTLEAAARGEDALLYDAPAALLFHHSPKADPADAAIAATYAMIAAESLHLGTCLIGMVGPFLTRNRAWRTQHHIPDDHTLALTLILGHPAHPTRHALRRRLASVTWA